MISDLCILNPGPEVIKFFFQAQTSLKCYFFMLTHVKMPTTVGILTFVRRKKFMLN